MKLPGVCVAAVGCQKSKANERIAKDSKVQYNAKHLTVAIQAPGEWEET